MKLKRGISYTELIFIVAIMAILFATTYPFLSNNIVRNNMDLTASRILSILRKAQIYAITRKDGQTWGVCSTAGKIRLYSASCNSPAYYEDFQPYSSIAISGLSDITFSNTRGEPNVIVSILLTSSLETFTIVINNAGGINLQ